MNVEIHRENYQAYVERKAIMDTQQQILHHVSGSQSAALIATPVIDYSRWSIDRYNWTEMERHLYGVADTQAALEDDEDEDHGDDGDGGDDGDDLYAEESDDATGEEVY
jgi:hypothetical protein